MQQSRNEAGAGLNVLGRCSNQGLRPSCGSLGKTETSEPQEGCRAAQGHLKMTGQRASSSALRSPSSARAPPLGLALIWGICIWFHLKKKSYIRFLKGFHWCSDQTSSDYWKLLDSVLLYHSALLMGEQTGLHQLLLKYSSRTNNTIISWGGMGYSVNNTRWFLDPTQSIYRNKIPESKHPKMCTFK